MLACLLVLLSILYGLNCESFIEKSVLLTTLNPSDNGASITVLKDVIIDNNISDSDPIEWELIANDEIGFHLQLSLNTLWSFHSTEVTTLTLYIYSDSEIGSTARDLLISFSQSNNIYFTVLIQIDKTDDNRIYPSCDNTIPYTQIYGAGNIKSIVNADNNLTRQQKATGNLNFSYIDYKTYPPIINYPLILILENHPLQNYLLYKYTNPGMSTKSCGYIKMQSNIPLDIYFAAEHINQYFNINSINITHKYQQTNNPTINPTNYPSKQPTTLPSITTIYPISSPSTNQPTTTFPTFNTALTTAYLPTTSSQTTYIPTTSKNAQIEEKNKSSQNTVFSNILDLILIGLLSLVIVLAICLIYVIRKKYRDRKISKVLEQQSDIDGRGYTGDTTLRRMKATNPRQQHIKQITPISDNTGIDNIHSYKKYSGDYSSDYNITIRRNQDINIIDRKYYVRKKNQASVIKVAVMPHIEDDIETSDDSSIPQNIQIMDSQTILDASNKIPNSTEGYYVNEESESDEESESSQSGEKHIGTTPQGIINYNYYNGYNRNYMNDNYEIKYNDDVDDDNNGSNQLIVKGLGMELIQPIIPYNDNMK